MTLIGGEGLCNPLLVPLPDHDPSSVVTLPKPESLPCLEPFPVSAWIPSLIGPLPPLLGLLYFDLSLAWIVPLDLYPSWIPPLPGPLPCPYFDASPLHGP